jgi:hypothetical protein
LCCALSPPNYRVNWSESWVESAPGDLVRRLPKITRELEKAVPTLTTLIADAERKAEEEHERWEAASRRWRVEEAARRRAQAVKESREQLLAIVGQWSLAKSHESFFQDAERAAATKDAAAQSRIRTQLEHARALLGGTNPLEHFDAWRSPEDRLGSTVEDD